MSQTVTTVTIEEAAQHLAELVSELNPGEEIALTLKNRTVARIVAAVDEPVKHRRAGAGKGILHILKEDDAHLEDFKEYMQ